MRKEYVIFFVLLGVAAIITGFTVGFVANYSYIEAAIKAQQHLQPAPAENEKVSPEAADKDGKSKPEATDNSPAKTDTEKESAVTAESGTYSVVQSYEDGTMSEVSISPADMNQINLMMDSLQVAASADVSQRIRSFQQQSGLSVTGQLDNTTLDAMVDAMARNRAEQLQSDNSSYGG